MPGREGLVFGQTGSTVDATAAQPSADTETATEPQGTARYPARPPRKRPARAPASPPARTPPDTDGGGAQPADASAARPTPGAGLGAFGASQSIHLKRLEYARQQTASKKWTPAQADDYIRDRYADADGNPTITGVADLAHQTSLNITNLAKSLPFAPQLAGALKTVTSGMDKNRASPDWGAYAPARDAAFKAAQVFRGAHPTAATVAPAAAMLPTMALGPGPESSVLGALAKGALAGGGAGGATAMGYTDPSQPMGERVAESVPAAVAGAATGGVGAAGFQGVMNHLRTGAGARLSAPVRLSAPGPMLAPRATAAGVTGPAALREAAGTMERVRPGVWRPADLSESLAGSADYAMTESPSVKAAFEGDLRARAHGAQGLAGGTPTRLLGDIDRMVGPRPDFDALYGDLSTNAPSLRGNPALQAAAQKMASGYARGPLKNLAQQAAATGDYDSYVNLFRTLRDEGHRLLGAAGETPRQVGSATLSSKQVGVEMLKAHDAIGQELGQQVPGFQRVQALYKQHAAADELRDQLRSAGSKYNVRQFTEPSIDNENRLRTVFGNTYDQWRTNTAAEEAFARTARAGQGSQTAGRLATAEATDTPHPTENIRESLSPSGLATRGYMRLPILRGKEAGLRAANRMGPMLLKPGQNINEWLEQVRALHGTARSTPAYTGVLSALAAGALKERQ